MKSFKKILPTILWLGAAVMFFLYAVVVYKVGSGTGFYVVWLAAGVCCILMEIFRRIKLWSKLPTPIKAIVLAAFFAAVALFIVVEAFIISGFNKKGEPGLDAVIVLGAQVRSTGPSIVLKCRLDKAYTYLTENPDTLCICSGGQGSNEHAPEAIVMKEYLVDKGISEDRILIEDKSRNTIENILFSYELLDEENMSIGIITNNFHVFRGCAIARKQGGENIYGISAPSNPRYLPNNMTREFIGVVKDTLLGNM